MWGPDGRSYKEFLLLCHYFWCWMLCLRQCHSDRRNIAAAACFLLLSLFQLLWSSGRGCYFPCWAAWFVSVFAKMVLVFACPLDQFLFPQADWRVVGYYPCHVWLSLNHGSSTHHSSSELALLKLLLGGSLWRFASFTIPFSVPFAMCPMLWLRRFWD